MRKRQILIVLLAVVAGVCAVPIAHRLGARAWEQVEAITAVALIGSSVLWLWYTLERYRTLGQCLLIVPYSVVRRFVLYGALAFYVVLVGFSVSLVATGATGWSSMLIVFVNLPTYLYILVRATLRVQIREDGFAFDMITYRWTDIESFEWTGSHADVLKLYHHRKFTTLWSDTVSIPLDPEYRSNVTILLRSAGVPQLAAGQRLARD